MATDKDPVKIGAGYLDIYPKLNQAALGKMRSALNTQMNQTGVSAGRQFSTGMARGFTSFATQAGQAARVTGRAVEREVAGTSAKIQGIERSLTTFQQGESTKRLHSIRTAAQQRQSAEQTTTQAVNALIRSTTAASAESVRETMRLDRTKLAEKLRVERESLSATANRIRSELAQEAGLAAENRKMRADQIRQIQEVSAAETRAQSSAIEGVRARMAEDRAAHRARMTHIEQETLGLQRFNTAARGQVVATGRGAPSGSAGKLPPVVVSGRHQEPVFDLDDIEFDRRGGGGGRDKGGREGRGAKARQFLSNVAGGVIGGTVSGAGTASRKLASGVSSATKKTKSGAKWAAGGGALGGASGAGLADLRRSIYSGLSNTGYDNQRVLKTMRDVQDFAEKTPFGVSEALDKWAQTTRNLEARSKSKDAAMSKSFQLLRAISDFNALYTGGDREKFGRAMDALDAMLDEGFVGIRHLRQFARGMGFSVTDVRQMLGYKDDATFGKALKKKQVEPISIVDAIIKERDKRPGVAGVAEKQGTETIGGAFSGAADKFKRNMADLLQSDVTGEYTKLGTRIRDLANKLGEIAGSKGLQKLVGGILDGLVTAIEGLSNLFKKAANTPQIRNFFKEGFDTLRKTAKALADGFRKIVTSPEFGEFAQASIGAVAKAAKAVADGLRKVASSENFRNFAKMGFRYLANAIKTLAEAFKNIVTSPEFKDFAKTVFGGLVLAAKALADGFLKIVKSEGFQNFAKGVFAGLSKAIKAVAEAFQRILKSEGFKSFAKDLFSKLVEGIKKLAKGFHAIVTSKEFKDFAKTSFGVLAKVVKALVDGFSKITKSEGFKNFGKAAFSTLTKVIKKLAEVFESIVKSEGFKTFVKSVKETLPKVFKKIGEIFDSALKSDGMKKFAEGAMNLLGQTARALGELFKTLSEDEGLKKLVTGIFGALVLAVEGVTKGLKSMLDFFDAHPLAKELAKFFTKVVLITAALGGLLLFVQRFTSKIFNSRVLKDMERAFDWLKGDKKSGDDRSRWDRFKDWMKGRSPGGGDTIDVDTGKAEGKLDKLKRQVQEICRIASHCFDEFGRKVDELNNKGLGQMQGEIQKTCRDAQSSRNCINKVVEKMDELDTKRLDNLTTRFQDFGRGVHGTNMNITSMITSVGNLNNSRMDNILATVGRLAGLFKETYDHASSISNQLDVLDQKTLDNLSNQLTGVRDRTGESDEKMRQLAEQLDALDQKTLESLLEQFRNLDGASGTSKDGIGQLITELSNLNGQQLADLRAQFDLLDQSSGKSREGIKGLIEEIAALNLKDTAAIKKWFDDLTETVGKTTGAVGDNKKAIEELDAKRLDEIVKRFNEDLTPAVDKSKNAVGDLTTAIQTADNQKLDKLVAVFNGLKSAVDAVTGSVNGLMKAILAVIAIVAGGVVGATALRNRSIPKPPEPPRGPKPPEPPKPPKPPSEADKNWEKRGTPWDPRQWNQKNAEKSKFPDVDVRPRDETKMRFPGSGLIENAAEYLEKKGPGAAKAIWEILKFAATKGKSKPKLGRARGGVIPGYRPGVDTVPALLSPGEAVLRPEIARALGEHTINQWNEWARRGYIHRYAKGTPFVGMGVPGFLSKLREILDLKAGVGAFRSGVTVGRTSDALGPQFGGSVRAWGSETSGTVAGDLAISQSYELEHYLTHGLPEVLGSALSQVGGALSGAIGSIASSIAESFWQNVWFGEGSLVSRNIRFLADVEKRVISNIGSVLGSLNPVDGGKPGEGPKEYLKFNSLPDVARSGLGAFRDVIEGVQGVPEAIGGSIQAVKSLAGGLSGSLSGIIDSVRSMKADDSEHGKEVFAYFWERANTRLPKMSGLVPGFAEGGIVPGYSPGSDRVLALLSPGEAVLRPETVRQLGRRAVRSLNDLAKSGGAGISEMLSGKGVSEALQATKIPPPDTSEFDAAVSKVKEALDNLAEDQRKVTEQIKESLSELVAAYEEAMTKIKEAIANLGEEHKKVVEEVKASLTELSTAHQDMVSQVKTSLDEYTSSHESAAAKVKDILSGSSESYKELATNIKESLSEIDKALQAHSEATKTAWDQISNTVKTSVDNEIKPAHQRLIENMQGPLTKAHQEFETTNKNVWTNIVNQVQTSTKDVSASFDTLRTNLDKLKQFFETSAEAIKRTWEQAMKAVENATRSTISGPYNRGAVAMTDNMAKLAGTQSPLQAIHLARGGIVPGYQPGVDTVPALLSKGEGILRPEVVRDLGPETVYRWNEQARKTGHMYAHGGVVDWTNYKTGSAWVDENKDRDYESYLKAFQDGWRIVVQPMLDKVSEVFGVSGNLLSGIMKKAMPWIEKWCEWVDRHTGGGASAVARTALQEYRQHAPATGGSRYTGGAVENWCASFVSFVVDKAKANKAYGGSPTGTPFNRWPAVATWVGAVPGRVSTQESRPGDLMVYRGHGPGGWQHINIRVPGGTVGGNESNQLKYSGGYWTRATMALRPRGGGGGDAAPGGPELNPWPGSIPRFDGTLGGGVDASIGNSINKAMRLTGVSGRKWSDGLSTLIHRGSNANPRAINLRGNNVPRSLAPRGLMQLSPYDFRRYHVPGTSHNIFDPVSNIASGIRLIQDRHRGINRFMHANRGRRPRAYWRGVRSASPGLAIVGERGPELVDLHGGERIFNTQETKQVLGKRYEIHVHEAKSEDTTQAVIRGLKYAETMYGEF